MRFEGHGNFPHRHFGRQLKNHAGWTGWAPNREGKGRQFPRSHPTSWPSRCHERHGCDCDPFSWGFGSGMFICGVKSSDFGSGVVSVSSFLNKKIEEFELPVLMTLDSTLIRPTEKM